MTDCKHDWVDHYFPADDPPEADDLSDEIQAEADEINAIVDELLAQRYPDGPPENLDWGGLYADAYELQAERAAVGSPCPNCGQPLPPDLLCPCQTESEPPG